MYTEILKLKDMLEKANIPFAISTHVLDKNGYHLGYPSLKYPICSVVEFNYSYGHEGDKLEIMGLLTEEEKKHDDVVGYLSAEEVFNRISKHYKESN